MTCLIDSHCHLFYDDYKDNLDERLLTASLVGVKYFLSVSTEFGNFEPNLKIAHTHENIFVSLGIHPSSSYKESDIDVMKQLCDDEKVVAIGEVGLDYFYDTNTKEYQKTLLCKMLDLSNYFSLPYIFHARECYPDILDIIQNYNDIRGVFHCFTDSLENLKRILDAGFFVSFTGVITFKNAQALRELVKFVPLDRMMVETDCPYLTPVPYRGRVNEPAFVFQIAEIVAGIKNLDIEYVSEMTSNNFFNLFKKASR